MEKVCKNCGSVFVDTQAIYDAWESYFSGDGKGVITTIKYCCEECNTSGTLTYYGTLVNNVIDAE